MATSVSKRQKQLRIFTWKLLGAEGTETRDSRKRSCIFSVWSSSLVKSENGLPDFLIIRSCWSIWIPNKASLSVHPKPWPPPPPIICVQNWIHFSSAGDDWYSFLLSTDSITSHDRYQPNLHQSRTKYRWSIYLERANVSLNKTIDFKGDRRKSFDKLITVLSKQGKHFL